MALWKEEIQGKEGGGDFPQPEVLGVPSHRKSSGAENLEISS